MYCTWSQILVKPDTYGHLEPLREMGNIFLVANGTLVLAEHGRRRSLHMQESIFFFYRSIALRFVSLLGDLGTHSIFLRFQMILRRAYLSCSFKGYHFQFLHKQLKDLSDLTMARKEIMKVPPVQVLFVVNQVTRTPRSSTGESSLGMWCCWHHVLPTEGLESAFKGLSPCVMEPGIALVFLENMYWPCAWTLQDEG